MKTTGKLLSDQNYLKILQSFMITIVLMVCFTIQAFANKPIFRPINKFNADTLVSKSIYQQILACGKELNYPLSVERFYKANGYRLIWVAPDSVKTHASDAMLLLDCVLHYGLSHNDYHPKELLYDRLDSINTKWSETRIAVKARFDIMLTDAMISFMNNLHYGKLNPVFSGNKIDESIVTSFKAETELKTALLLKNFMRSVENAQPKAKEYTDMQDHMRLLTGQYQDDCYEVPQEDIRIMAINLERMRWINSNDKTYIEINIPAYSLKFYLTDTVYKFKTIVGSPGHPTPTLLSAISYFKTAPAWKVPNEIFVNETLLRAMRDSSYLENNHFSIYDRKGNYVKPTKANLASIKKNNKGYYARQSPGCDNTLGLIEFGFPNVYAIDLHDTPEQLLFGKKERDLNNACISVEHAEKLAALLLKNDVAVKKLASMRNALENYQTKTFKLKKSLPIKITYLTCIVKEGLLIKYKDIYNLDKSMEMALYNSTNSITMR